MAKHTGKNKIKFGLAAIAVGAKTYWDSTTVHYNNTAYQTAEAAAKYFKEEELRQYGDLITRYNHGGASEDEISERQNSKLKVKRSDMSCLPAYPILRYISRPPCFVNRAVLCIERKL